MYRSNFPTRKEAKRKSVLGRRMKDVELYANDPSKKDKLEIARTDVTNLKAKLGIN